MARFDGVKFILMVVFKLYLNECQQTFQNLVCFRFQKKYQKCTDLMPPSNGLTLFLSLRVTYLVLLMLFSIKMLHWLQVSKFQNSY